VRPNSIVLIYKSQKYLNISVCIFFYFFTFSRLLQKMADISEFYQEAQFHQSFSSSERVTEDKTTIGWRCCNRFYRIKPMCRTKWERCYLLRFENKIFKHQMQLAVQACVYMECIIPFNIFQHMYIICLLLCKYYILFNKPLHQYVQDLYKLEILSLWICNKNVCMNLWIHFVYGICIHIQVTKEKCAELLVFVFNI